ncbi:vWA domain-containing protein [Caldisphaera lagunensis]|uniref:vWA domain-containing protein n=1 Tax=Caldisphaera lagunensis TaxID=200415 RepID=UPI0006624AC9|nr:vWA domain-containing protein [Caldisphaera lagunensis]
MKFIGEAVIIGVDTSISMARKDYKPNRFENAKRAASIIARSLFSRNLPTLLSLMIFYRYSFPLTDLTDRLEVIEKAILQLKIMGKATAPSEIIKDAYLILRNVNPGYHKRIILITDAGFNEGVSLEMSALLLSISEIELDMLTFGSIPKSIFEHIDRSVKNTKGVWLHSSNTDEILANAAKLGEMYPD